MNILKTIKEFFFPKTYSDFENAEIGKKMKIDYFPETVDLIYNSNKLTDSEKHRMVENIVYDYTQNKIVDKHAFEYLKKRLVWTVWLHNGGENGREFRRFEKRNWVS